MRKADELIEKFLDSLGNKGGSVYVDLFKSWNQIAGDRLAAHAQPVDVNGKSLVVQTDHPGWSQMVIMNRSRILKQLARRFPELGLTGITVHLASDLHSAESHDTADTPLPVENAPAPRPPSADETEALEKIADAELRSVLGRLRDEIAGDEQAPE